MAKPTTENIALPDFPVTLVRLLDGNFIEEDISLQQLVANRQKGLILYFYPKDNTPGCTTQATDFTAHLHDFDDLGYDIIGVSRDSAESHKKFIEKYDLQIPLISDSDEKLCQYFEVIKEKNMYGKKPSVWCAPLLYLIAKARSLMLSATCVPKAMPSVSCLC